MSQVLALIIRTTKTLVYMNVVSRVLSLKHLYPTLPNSECILNLTRRYQSLQSKLNNGSKRGGGDAGTVLSDLSKNYLV